MQNCSSKFQIDIKTRVYQFSLEVIKFLRKLPDNQISRILTNQLLRSSTSIGANIVEAQAASSKNDFRKFINYALKSANETKYWFSLINDAGIVTDDEILSLLNEADELTKILGASMLKLRGRK